MTCKSGWYEQYFYDSNTFSSLVPSKLFGCSSTSSDKATELSDVLVISMIVGLLFLLYVMYRSCSKNRTDWYRLIGVYILGTIGVPLSIKLGPSEGGFNRILGFGILTHNAAEIIILGHIWFGDVNNRKARNGYGALWVMMYIWVITALICFVGEAALFYILMLQGAFCDWSLVCSFCYLGKWMDDQNKGAENDPAVPDRVERADNRCYSKFGIAAAFTHVLTIHPLFIGIASSWVPLNGITVVFLVPTFILYIWFTAADKHDRPIVIQPNTSSEDVLDAERNRLMLKILKREGDADLKHRRQGSGGHHVVSSASGTVAGDGGKAEVVMARILDSAEKKEEELDADKKANEKQEDEKEKRTTYGDVIRIGLIAIGGKGKEKAMKKTMGRIAMIAFLIDVVDVTLIFFLPCLIDFQPIVCGDN